MMAFRNALWNIVTFQIFSLRELRFSHTSKVSMAKTWWNRSGQALGMLVSLITVETTPQVPEVSALGRLTVPLQAIVQRGSCQYWYRMARVVVACTTTGPEEIRARMTSPS